MPATKDRTRMLARPIRTPAHGDPAHLPPGASLTPDWITPQQETALVTFLDPGDWSGELKRRVRHFGYRYDYRTRSATAESRIGPLPEAMRALAERLVADVFFVKRAGPGDCQ